MDKLELEKRGNFEIVGTLLDVNAEAIRQAIEDLYFQTEKGDLTLLYYSGHGYKGRDGRLYLAARNTKVNRLLSTGVRETFIHDAMSHSRSRHRVVILDSCFSGAFIKGRKGGAEPLLLEKLKGEATAVLTSSSTIQYSFEEEGRNSLFTRYLIEGIETGQADEDKDGLIKIDELFDYTEQQVRSIRPEQTPMMELSTRESAIILAKTPKELETPLRVEQYSQVSQEISTEHPTRSINRRLAIGISIAVLAVLGVGVLIGTLVDNFGSTVQPPPTLTSIGENSGEDASDGGVSLLPNTETPTETSVPPTFTSTATETPILPTFTQTPIPPTFTYTPTKTPVPPTFTSTPTKTPRPPPPTFTPTKTPVPPTSTRTPTRTPRPPTATKTPTKTPIPSSSVLYSQDFENGSIDDSWTVHKGDWTIETEGDGNRYWRATGPENYPQAWIHNTEWANYAFQLRVRPIKGTVFINVREGSLPEDTSNSFISTYFDVESNWLSFAQDDNTGFNSFSGRNFSLPKNKWHTIRIEAMGDEIRLYVNDSFVMSGKHTGHEQGGIGLYMGGEEEFHFDDILVYKL